MFSSALHMENINETSNLQDIQFKYDIGNNKYTDDAALQL